MVGYTPTPDYYNDYICHYGVKGMKWGKRKAQLKGKYAKLIGKIRNKQSAEKRKERYVASHLANDITSGNRKINRPYGDVKNDKYTDKYGRTHNWSEETPRSLDAHLYKSWRGQKVVKARSLKDSGNYGSGTESYTTYNKLKKAITSEEKRKKKKS